MKEKLDEPAAACDLYTSRLFAGRRRYVERTCDRWFILSALLGLVPPETVVTPYDNTLKGAGVAEKRAWSARVLAQLDGQRLPPASMMEIHAGAEYREFGLVEGLGARSFGVTIPTEGLPIGLQLRFYKDSLSLS